MPSIVIVLFQRFTIIYVMVGNQTSEASPSSVVGLLSHNNGKINLALPISTKAKFGLFISMTVIVVVGLVGNSLVAYYLNVNERKRLGRYKTTSPFGKNLTYYIRSLVISDILCPAVTLPLFYLELFTDVLKGDWLCKVERYCYFVFPGVTINSLVVISVERFCATRDVPRVFGFSTVRRVVVLAWLSGLLITFVPVSNFKLLKYELNGTHFTVTCRYDNRLKTSRALMSTYSVLEFILPCILLVYCNICVMKTAWRRLSQAKRSTDIGSSCKRKQITRNRGILLLVVITFGFIIPYIVSYTYIMYNSIAKPNISFSTDFIIRMGGGVLVTANSAVNFIIYTMQVKGFRIMLKKVLRKSCFCKGHLAKITISAGNNCMQNEAGAQQNVCLRKLPQLVEESLGWQAKMPSGGQRTGSISSGLAQGLSDEVKTKSSFELVIEDDAP